MKQAEAQHDSGRLAEKYAQDKWASPLPDYPQTFRKHDLIEFSRKDFLAGYSAREEDTRKLREENQALIEIMERHQKIIDVMAYDLIVRGVNFDFQKAEDRHAAMKKERDL